jgi:phage terminase large subunit GpA-like protein
MGGAMSDFLTAEEIYKKNGFDLLRNKFMALPDSGKIPLPQEWAAENRYMPPEITETPGMFDIELVPQYAEILAIQHPDNPINQTALMKSVQSAGTTSVLENVMGFWIKYQLGSIILFQSSKTMGKIKSSSAIDVMIDNAGLGGNVNPMSKRMKRKTGDTALYKEFSGGVKLMITSYNSEADQKSNTFNLMCLDELDSAPRELNGQGDVVGTIKGRAVATSMNKLISISTPSMMETSRIYKEFLDGDQRKYYVPCPHCGEYQILELAKKSRDFGLMFDFKKDNVTGKSIVDPFSVRYKCISCQHDFYQESLRDISNRGQWRPTWQDSNHRPKSEKHASFHISAFYSQVLNGGDGWLKICEAFAETGMGSEILKMKAFTINYLALPWAHVDKNYTGKMLMARAESYCMKEPPAEAGLIFFGGLDVQKDRLELSVLACSRNEFWVADYEVFWGNPANPYDNCWNSMRSYVYEARYQVGNVIRPISQVAIDSNWDPKKGKRDVKGWETKAHAVFQFVAKEGFGDYKAALNNPAESFFIAIYGKDGAVGMIQPKPVKGEPISVRYEVSVSKFKSLIFGNIDKAGGEYSIHVPKYRRPEGGLAFDEPLDIHWYDMFCSERYQEITPGVYGWKPIYKRNEVLDTVVYSMACYYLQNMNNFSEDDWDLLESRIRNESETV